MAILSWASAELLGKAPDPARAARLTAYRPAVLKHAGRYKIAERTDAILAALRSPQLGRPPALTAAYAVTVWSLVAVITTLNERVSGLQGLQAARDPGADRPDRSRHYSPVAFGELAELMATGRIDTIQVP